MSSSALIDAAEAPVHVGLHWGHSGVCRWGHRMLLEQLAIGEGNSAVNTHSSTRTTDLTLDFIPFLALLPLAVALATLRNMLLHHYAVVSSACGLDIWNIVYSNTPHADPGIPVGLSRRSDMHLTL